MSTIEVEQVCAVERKSFYAVTHLTRPRLYKSDVSEIKNPLTVNLVKEQNTGHGTLLYI
ncbi:unannotated protein [freshwater metagenome]|uniref:Unannotated protein n=1 Tax=freshwater metagenome TaxID=449393 RepID=A0A6J6W402_9ZZZZ